MRKFQAIFIILLAFFCYFLPIGGNNMAQAQFVGDTTTNQQVTAGPQPEATTMFDKVTTVINFLFGALILFSLLALIISALKFFVAGGSEAMLSSANNTWIGAVIGLCVGLVGYVLVSIIRYYLR